MQQINKQQFEKLTNGKDIVVVDFFATWCGPCKMMHPVLEEAEKLYPKVKFAQVNIDAEEELAITQGVRAVPTFIAYKGGNKIGQTMGYTPLEEFAEFIEDLK